PTTPTSPARRRAGCRCSRSPRAMRAPESGMPSTAYAWVPPEMATAHKWRRAARLQARDRAPREAQALPRFRLVRAVGQQVRRVIGHDQRHALVAVQPSAQARDARLGAEQRLHREAPHCEYQLGLDQLELAQQVRRALRHLEGLGVAVARWAALEHIADVDVLAARKADRREHVVEQAPRLSDEGLAAGILFGARRLADQQPVGLLVADAEHGLRAGLAQPAGGATLHRRLQLRPLHLQDARGAV